MIKLNEKQQRLYDKHADLAEWLACEHACIEADHITMLTEADRSLRSAVVNYNKEIHGDFEDYATQLIERDLERYVHSNGNALYVIERGEEDDEYDVDDCEETALEYEINRILRDAGFEEDRGFEDDEFFFS